MHVDDTTFRDLVDAELGDTPPAPADRLEWVVRAARSNGPPGRTGRLPRAGYLALAVTVLSTTLVTGLLVSARIGAGENATRDTGDAGPAVVHDTASPPASHVPATRLGPAVSTSSDRPTRRAVPIHPPVPAEATVRPRTRPTAHRSATTSRPTTARPTTARPTRSPTDHGNPTNPPQSQPPSASPTVTPTHPTTSPTPTPRRTGYIWP